MKAINAIRENEIIENAVILKARFVPEDAYGYYAVPADEAEAHLSGWREWGAADCDYAPEITVDNQDDYWIGLKVASIGSIAAWGHARLEV